MRIPRKRLKHVARPNPTVIPKSPTRLDALAAAAFVKLSLEIPNVPKKTRVEEEDDDDVLESMEKMPALLERIIVDSDAEDSDDEEDNDDEAPPLEKPLLQLQSQNIGSIYTMIWPSMARFLWGQPNLPNKASILDLKVCQTSLRSQLPTQEGLH